MSNCMGCNTYCDYMCEGCVDECFLNFRTCDNCESETCDFSHKSSDDIQDTTAIE